VVKVPGSAVRLTFKSVRDSKKQKIYSSLDKWAVVGTMWPGYIYIYTRKRRKSVYSLIITMNECYPCARIRA